MTTATTTTGSTSDLRKQARQVYRESVAAGAGLSGKALGERFGRSERWGASGSLKSVRPCR